MTGASEDQRRRGPLRGIRVVELAGLGPAPFAAMVLADLGAEVLRIDRPGRAPIAPDATAPDATAPDAIVPGTSPGGPAPGPGADGAANPWDVLNRNRLGVVVDLVDPAGSAFVRSLVSEVDVFIEGNRPGAAERLGLGPDDVMALNDRLVYGRMTGWGQEGPMAQRAGHDLDYLAVAGVLAHVGRAGQPPTPPLNLVADFGGGGMLLVAGILAALVERSVSGLGQVVDAAMVDGAALLMGPLFGAWASGYWAVERGTNLLDSGAPFYDCYRCGDGGWIAIAAIEPRFFSELLRGLDLDPADLPDQHDQPRWPELRNRIASVVETRSRDEWAAHFADLDACVAPVLTMGEAPQHPHALARDGFTDVDGVLQPSPAPRFSRTPSSAPRVARTGSDPVAVLHTWGADRSAVDVLVARGVIA
ncbi:MAG: CoA transferase [Actinobacteria bacterium]|nr:CoA transferase [Actinomycetota bacterium]